MKTTTLFTILLLAATAVAQPPPPSAATDASTAITQLRTGLVESFVKNDIDRLITYLDPDVVVTWQNGEVCRGPEAVRTYYQRMMTGENRIVREVKAEPEVLGRHVYGDWALSWGNLHDHFILTDGRDLPLNTLFTATIKKSGDRWLVSGFHASVNAFDNPVLKLAIRKTSLWTGIGAGIIGLLVGTVIGRRRRSQSPAA